MVENENRPAHFPFPTGLRDELLGEGGRINGQQTPLFKTGVLILNRL
jgi:hypothetical protein